MQKQLFNYLYFAIISVLSYFYFYSFGSKVNSKIVNCSSHVEHWLRFYLAMAMFVGIFGVQHLIARMMLWLYSAMTYIYWILWAFECLLISVCVFCAYISCTFKIYWKTLDQIIMGFLTIFGLLLFLWLIFALRQSVPFFLFVCWLLCQFFSRLLSSHSHTHNDLFFSFASYFYCNLCYIVDAVCLWVFGQKFRFLQSVWFIRRFYLIVVRRTEKIGKLIVYPYEYKYDIA